MPMDEREYLGYKRLAAAINDDIVIDDILGKLNDEELELIGDSIICAINGDCDEFCHRLFEKLIPNKIHDDKFGKWKAIQNLFEDLWNTPPQYWDIPNLSSQELWSEEILFPRQKIRSRVKRPNGAVKK